jgi:hypothetical protein
MSSPFFSARGVAKSGDAARKSACATSLGIFRSGAQ